MNLDILNLMYIHGQNNERPKILLILKSLKEHCNFFKEHVGSRATYLIKLQ